MLSYCLKYRKNTDSKNLKVVKIKNSNNNAIIKMSDVSLGLFRDEEIGRLLSIKILVLFCFKDIK